MRILKTHQIIAMAFLILVFSITLYSYWPGLRGIFIFDDIPNLSPLGRYTELSSWDRFLLFILEGYSGPTGRPISLASFYINDNAWPSDPSSFTFTNVMIHILNGILVFWFVYKLASTLKIPQKQQVIFSSLASAFWVLHPLHTTTVLYIVQRMTELSATFTLTGLLFYLYGRETLFRKPKKALVLLTLGVGSSLLLSVLSKENGILLTAYVICLEFFILKSFNIPAPKSLYKWSTPIIFLPFIFIITYLGYRVYIGSGYEIRDFTIYERVLTQTRILFDYLHHIMLPNIGGSSLFHDDYEVSKGLLNPLSTLFATTGLIGLFILTILARKKAPFISFSISWFFLGHLLESTVLPLELYFEHRNYLPMLGFIIAITWYISQFWEYHKIPTSIFSVVILGLFVFMVHQSSTLWSKPKELTALWYAYHPNSLRAQEAYIWYTKPTEALSISKKQLEKRENSSYTKLWELNQSCLKGKITNKELENTLEKLKKVTIQASTANALNDFIKSWYNGYCENISQKQIVDFLVNSTQLENMKNESIYLHYSHYWLFEIYLADKDLDGVITNLEKSYLYRPDIQLLLLQGKYLASAGYHKKAIDRLNDTSSFEKSLRSRLILKIRQNEIEKLKTKIMNSKNIDS